MTRRVIGRPRKRAAEPAPVRVYAARDAARDAASATRPRVLLVSDPFHMLRLDVLARLHGMQPLPSPTRTSPISANRAVLEYMLRESVALPTDVALLLWLKMTGRRLVDA